MIKIEVKSSDSEISTTCDLEGLSWYLRYLATCLKYNHVLVFMPFLYDLCQRHISIMTSFKIFIPLSPFSEAHTSLALPAPRLLLLGARPTVNFQAEQAVNLLNGWRSYEILES
jgi:hypothetical protein